MSRRELAKPTPQGVQMLLTQIRNDLYTHLDYHYKGLRKPLDLLIDQLESQHLRPRTGRGKRRVQAGKELFTEILRFEDD
jgi:hypothetical protein